MKQTDSLTRRQFCGLAAGALFGAALPGVPRISSATNEVSSATRENIPPLATPSPTVVLIRNSNVWEKKGLQANLSLLRRMVDRAVCLALGEENIGRAWRKIVSPSDTIGIKISGVGGRTICTNPSLVQAIVESLLAVEIPPGKIIVWDFADGILAGCGLPVQKAPENVRYMGSPSMASQVFKVAGIETRLSTLVMDTCTVLINLPTLKAHAWANLSGALKNYMGAIPNAAEFHPNSCVAVGDLNQLGPLRDKNKLVIMDALRPLYDKGPGDSPAFRWNYSGIVVGTDPVAIDRVGMSILEEKRTQAKGAPWPLPAVSYLERAAELGLGQADLSQIHLQKVEEAL